MQCFVLSILNNLNIFVNGAPQQRYPYFDVAVGLAHANGMKE
jgi:hypothetical protein